MKIHTEMIGQKYDKVTVLEYDYTNDKGQVYWKVQCDCGTIYSLAQKTLRTTSLRKRCKQCGYKQATESRLGSLYENLKTTKFGYLSVLQEDLSKPSGTGQNKYWICQCDCGNTTSVTTTALVNGLVKTCGVGCPNHSKILSDQKLNDLTGQTFHSLTVLHRDMDYEKNYASRGSYWLCQCKCGQFVHASRTSLIEGTRQSCDLCKKGSSIGENNIEQLLIKNNIKYRKQVTFADLKGVGGGACKFDFGIYNDQNDLIRLVEFDGELHYITVDYLNSATVKANDPIKNEYCKIHNIPLIRIPYWERDNITLDLILGEKYLL